MEYLGIDPERLRVGVFDFTGCEGCQLQMANKEATLGAFLDAVDIVEFREISSDTAPELDVAFIDGAIGSALEAERVKGIRARSKALVALGTCACFGGVNRMRNTLDIEKLHIESTGRPFAGAEPVRPVADVVDVDVALPGCPIDKGELERAVQHLALGVPMTLPVYPVCVECKQRFTTCVMELGQLCLGPVTRAGCNAPCPAGGLGCWGCRGPAEDANLDTYRDIVAERGFSKAELDERLGFFGGFDVVAAAAQPSRDTALCAQETEDGP